MILSVALCPETGKAMTLSEQVHPFEANKRNPGKELASHLGYSGSSGAIVAGSCPGRPHPTQ